MTNSHALRAVCDLLCRDGLLLAGKVVVLCQEEHAMALLHARTATLDAMLEVSADRVRLSQTGNRACLD